MKNGSNQEQEIQPMMILTIDIGNGHVDKLQLFDLNNIEQETYDFCVKNKLDFNTMQEINTQIQNVLKDKQLEEEQEIETVFQEIKEEDDEKITENNVNEVREQESIIITNSNEMDTQKENNNINNNNNNDIIPENIIEEKNNIMIDDKNKFEKENDNINDFNINNQIKKNNNNNNNNHNQSIRTNNSNSSYGNDNNKQNRKYNKSKKKNIKNNIKEAIAMAKEKTKQNNQKLIDKENIKNKNIFENMDNNENENINEENNNNIEDNINFEENKNVEENKNSNINQIYEKKEMNGKEENKNSEKNENNENKTNIENNLAEFNINNVNNENNDNNKNEDKEENKNENFENINKNLRENINNEVNSNQNIAVKEADKKEIENILNKNENRNEENEKNKEYISNYKSNYYQNNSKDSKKKKNSLSNNGSHISSYNPGKELYERGLKFKENEKEKLEALKKNLEVDEAEDNTFIPKINKLSEYQRERIKEKGLECTNPNIIRNYMEYKKEKIEILKKKTDEEFKKIYTFKPCINRSYSSTKIIKNQMGLENNMKGKNDSNNNNNNKVKNESRFDKLYNYRIDYKENKNRLEEKIYNEYSFKPQINENSCFYKLNIPFNERLQTYSNKSKENMIKIQQVYEKELGYDESFKPHLNKQKNKSLLKDRDEFFLNEIQKHNNNIQDINNNNNNNCNNNGNNNYIDHYTKLFLYGKKYQQEKNELTEKYYQNQNKSPQFCESTEEIINRKKEKSFRQIFKLLDGDEDSKISSTHMNISKLPKNISKILEPIFNELKEENETLNELEFIFVCEQLYLSLPWNDKRELTTFEDIAKKNIKKEKLLKEKNNYSFKPKINKRNFSFERPTKLYNDKSNKVLYQREINKNNEYSNYNNSNDIFNKSQNNYISNYKNKNNNNSNSYYIKKNKTNSHQKNQENKNNSNKINNRVNYFNLKISNQNIDINKKSQKEHNYINNNNNKDKFTILKNANINILGNSNIKNENKTEQKNSKVLGKRINYDNFVNVKVCS